MENIKVINVFIVFIFISFMVFGLTLSGLKTLTGCKFRFDLTCQRLKNLTALNMIYASNSLNSCEVFRL
jgi:hypothetical protein